MIWAVLIIGAVLVAALQLTTADKALAALHADRKPCAILAEPNTPMGIRVTLENRSRRIIPFAAVRCSLPFSKEGQFSFSAWLLPRQRLQREVPVSIPRRGRYVLEDMQVACGDFLGLKESEKTCGSFREIVVAPQPLASAPLQTMVGGFLGDVSTRRFIMEDPVLTLGYREYTGTEPMKRIAWNQTARHGMLMVKQNDYTVDPSVSVLLNVDTDLENREEALEACFSAARTVCAMLEEKGIRYSFSSNTMLLGKKHDNSGVAGLGRRHFDAILEVLGRAGSESVISLDQLLEQELQQVDRSGRILITPGGSEEASRFLLRMRQAEGLLVIRGKEVC